MDRIYINRRPGEYRIHIEIEASEIPDLLEDLERDEHSFGWDVSRRLLEILRSSRATFEVDRRTA
ncbi:hypothetical protein D3C59_37100, partial [Streptomyces sp. SHP22-7]